MDKFALNSSRETSPRPSDVLEAAYRQFRTIRSNDNLVALLMAAIVYQGERKGIELDKLRPTRASSFADLSRGIEEFKVGEASLNVEGPLNRLQESCRLLNEKMNTLLTPTQGRALETARHGDGSPETFGWKRVENNYGDFYSIRVETNRRLTSGEVRQLAGCLGYALRAELAGEDLSDPLEVVHSVRTEKRMALTRDRLEERQVETTVIIFDCDSTKSRRGDPDFLHAFQRADDYIQHGTPIRTTDRAGAGTKGTRLVEGIGRCGLKFWVQ